MMTTTQDPVGARAAEIRRNLGDGASVALSALYFCRGDRFSTDAALGRLLTEGVVVRVEHGRAVLGLRRDEE